MALRVVGAGLGRTGTASLKQALARLLGAPCYHMVDVFERPADVPIWRAAARGEPTDWTRLFEGYAAAVDWPASAFWEQIADAFPDAIILLSTRDPAEWWESASQTIFAPRDGGPPVPGFREMVDEVLSARFTRERTDRDATIAAFEKHVAHVRATAPKHRLVEWSVADGWGPLCAALKLPVPEEPFPRTNTREEWRARAAARPPSP
jgi:hypothetical protein